MIQPSCEQLTTIRLYGVLGALFGRQHRLAVGSVAEAIRALGCQLKGFTEFLTNSHDRGMDYAVFHGKRNISENELDAPHGGEDIRIAPILAGSKKGGIFQIIVGVVMVVAGAVLSAFGWAGIGVPLMKMGIAMVLGGIVQLLTPQPKGGNGRERPENQPSYAFSGPVNTQAQGNNVPVLYGELIIGSAVISAGITAKDHAIIPEGVEEGEDFEGGEGGGDTGGGSGGGWSGGGMQEWFEDWNLQHD
jgi:predicted phage tail protein